jgi:hypothetical protein
MEHRHGRRRSVDVGVTITTRAGVVGTGRIDEASASGARIDTSLPLTIHSVIALTLAGRPRLPLAHRPTLEAEVVRRTDSGFGIEWIQFSPMILHTLNGNVIEPARHKPARKAVLTDPSRRKERRT